MRAGDDLLGKALSSAAHDHDAFGRSLVVHNIRIPSRFARRRISQSPAGVDGCGSETAPAVARPWPTLFEWRLLAHFEHLLRHAQSRHRSFLHFTSHSPAHEDPGKSTETV